MRHLIVNADDYGVSPGVCAGIRRAHLEGIVTTTTVMMNMPDARHEIDRLRSETPELGIGVHLNITAGSPLLPRHQVASLVGADGRFLRPETLLRRVDQVLPEEVENEWRAQVESLFSAGVRPDHFDSHHHVAYLHPTLLRLFLGLARQYGCPVRPPLVADLDHTDILRGIPKDQANWFAENAPRMLCESKAQHPDRLYASFYGQRATLPALLAILEALPPGSSEIMCHPGQVDDLLRRGSSYIAQRESELAILTSPQVREAVKRDGIQLVRYAGLSA
ncbi:MAG: carbohydrate deacetylase [Anaerolineales bacterium]|jgi:predicted glycoside hydrolase/deacetylase ChbG (UPF0249 family)